ncbi:MAG: hypothetical protein M1818_004096 [Claussenomyces sp. TS43310]|nr:MAG: hypothetical protein M1818_004096 [Claussenomyces sp. TS43310]
MTRLADFFSGRRSESATRPPRFLAQRSSNVFIITTVCLAVFTDIFLYSIIVPVLPFALKRRAGVRADEVQHWVSILLAVYGAALLVGSPIAGWYADRSGSRRLPLLIGLLALSGATVMLCLARNVGLLVAGRLLQGLSASVVWTVGTALLVDTVGQKEIGQVLGYVTVGMSLGTLLAPLLGGIVYNRAGYYAVYYLCFGLTALDITLRLTLIEKKIARQWVDKPIPEFTISADPSQNQEDTSSARDVTEPAREASVSRQGSLSVSTCKQEDQLNRFHEPSLIAQQPAKPFSKFPPVLSLLTSRRLLAALYGCFVNASCLTAFDGIVPIFVHVTFGWGSIGAGLVFLAVNLPSFAAPGIGYLTDHYGPRWFAVVGFIAAMPFWVLLRLVTHDSMGQKVLFCALLSLIGAALILAMTPLMAEITYVVEAKEKKTPGIFGAKGAYAQAYGLFVTAFAAGSLVGPIWAGYVRAGAGWGTMTWTLGLFCVSGAVPVLIWTGGLITRQNAKSGDERAITPALTHRSDVPSSASTIV